MSVFSRKAAAARWPTTQRIVAECAAQEFSVHSVLVCRGPWSRTRGLLGRPEGTSALLYPCTSVHTIGMTRNIDVIYLSAAAHVVRIVKDLKPLRASFGPRGSFAVLEVPAGSSGKLEIGDVVTWVNEEMQA
jgi:uncharacterized membrane protein (UPF0127 family)